MMQCVKSVLCAAQPHPTGAELHQTERGKTMEKVEKILHDILNAGIALFRAGEGSVASAIADVKKTFEELKTKGAADNSEAAVKLRKTLDDIVKQASELNNKASSTYEESVKQLQDLYAKASAEIEKIVPKEQLEQIKSKIEELSKAIQERVEEVTKMGKEKAGETEQKTAETGANTTAV